LGEKLAENNLRDETAEAFAGTIEMNFTLRKLYLGNIDIKV